MLIITACSESMPGQARPASLSSGVRRRARLGGRRIGPGVCTTAAGRSRYSIGPGCHCKFLRSRRLPLSRWQCPSPRAGSSTDRTAAPAVAVYRLFCSGRVSDSEAVSRRDSKSRVSAALADPGPAQRSRHHRVTSAPWQSSPKCAAGPAKHFFWKIKLDNRF